jgi:dinuclear metal center YbgI/SA1388 family protein
MCRTVFVTNDLTEKVLEEAISVDADMIVSYHPTPFRKTNKLTDRDHISRIVLRCVAQGIAVYSPHTALDSAVDGLNDWLVRAAGSGTVVPLAPSDVIEGAGEGRLIEFEEELSLEEVLKRVKGHLGLEHVRVAPRMDAVATSKADSSNVLAWASEIRIRSMAVCAGSGQSVLSCAGGFGADLWLTGELSHHGVLDATQAGINVILTDHTHTERGYLPILARRIEEGMGGEAVCVVTKLDNDPLIVC